ncbi:MAG: Fic/DOC family protein [Pseudoramibacter sp.]|jgi:cell filamentation protein
MEDTIYCYPGTDVLVNKLDIHDADLLQNAERDLTARRLIQLQDHLIQGRFDYQHLKKIHAYIFQDIYDWAGKERTVDIAKSNVFCNVMFLPEQAKEIFAELRKENYLKDLTREGFIDRLVYFFGEVNALHPFREGNGRTQREFFRELALSAGYKIDYSMISQDEMIQASIDSFVRDYTKLKALMNKAVS